jgi:hypothetical protein
VAIHKWAYSQAKLLCLLFISETIQAQGLLKMNPASRQIFYGCLLLWLAVPLSGSYAESLGSQSAHAPAGRFERTDAPGENLGSRLVSVYSNFVSSVDGDRCPSVPSCSAYSRMAFKKHGFWVGWVMSVDRLLHEADERSVSPVVYDGNKLKVLDPVENNDFWWVHNDQPERQ